MHSDSQGDLACPLTYIVRHHVLSEMSQKGHELKDARMRHRPAIVRHGTCHPTLQMLPAEPTDGDYRTPGPEETDEFGEASVR